METATVRKMVNDSISETAQEAARLAKRGRRIAEDVIEDAEDSVRHHPLTTVAVATAGAFLVGTLVGFLLGRKT